MPLTARLMLSALLGVALACILVAPARATSGVDCGCSSTGPYVEPALPDTAALHVVPNTYDAYSPNQKYYLQVNTSASPYVATISRHVTPTTTAWQWFATMSISAGSWWGFSPDDDRFLVVAPSIPDHVTMKVWDLAGMVGQHSFVAPNYTDDHAAPVFTGFSPNGKHMVEAWVDFSNQATILIRDPVTGVVKFSGPFTFDANQTTNDPDKPRGVGAFGFSPDAGDRTLVYDWIDIHGGTNAKLVNLDMSTATAPASRTAFAPSTNFALDLLKFSPCGDMFAVTSLSTGSVSHSTQVDLLKTVDGPPTPATG